MRTARLIGLLLTLFLLQACSSTRIVEHWKAANDGIGPARTVLVIGDLRAWGPRSLIEEALARELRTRGVKAVAATSFFKGDELPPRDAVVSKVKELGCDAVLLVRFLRRESGDTHTPERLYSGQPDFDETWENTRAAMPDTSTPEVSYEFTTAVMRTQLYRAGSDKPVWSLLTRTKYQNNPLKQISPFAKAVVSRLAADGLIE